MEISNVSRSVRPWIHCTIPQEVSYGSQGKQIMDGCSLRSQISAMDSKHAKHYATRCVNVFHYREFHPENCIFDHVFVPLAYYGRTHLATVNFSLLITGFAYLL